VYLSKVQLFTIISFLLLILVLNRYIINIISENVHSAGFYKFILVYTKPWKFWLFFKYANYFFFSTVLQILPFRQFLGLRFSTLRLFPFPLFLEFFLNIKRFRFFQGLSAFVCTANGWKTLPGINFIKQLAQRSTRLKEGIFYFSGGQTFLLAGQISIKNYNSGCTFRQIWFDICGAECFLQFIPYILGAFSECKWWEIYFMQHFSKWLKVQGPQK